MLLQLKSLARESSPRSGQFQLIERLPYYVQSPCTLNCTYQLSQQDKFYLLNLKIEGDLSLTCQRCAELYVYPYHKEIEIAVCRDEERASQLMERYDCIVAHNEIDLLEILSDEICLYAPEKHESIDDCDPDALKWLQLEDSE